MLDPGNEDVGSESARPAGSGPAASLAGRAALGAGKAMIRLGDALGIHGLAALGARLIRGAVGLAPRLTEAILDRQAAALRELLREFREGDPDRALRRALPMGEPGGPRGGTPSASDRLPTNDLAYRLSKLLGGSGPADVWLGGQDVMAELADAYRRAAMAAIARGDHRRAAYIYGKLLHDYRSAAQALLRGGLFRDAAALFLAKLDDSGAAALAYESAGEIDRAVQLYRKIGALEAAGDLLRRAGEDEAAAGRIPPPGRTPIRFRRPAISPPGICCSGRPAEPTWRVSDSSPDG